jgi:hypothetical protein
VISNFTPVARENHFVPLPTAGKWREVLNSDAKDYGGSGVGNGMVDATVNKDGKISAEMVLPPLSTIMLELVEEAPAARVEKKAAKPVAKKRSSSRRRPSKGSRVSESGRKYMAEPNRSQPLSRDAMAYVLAGGRGSRLKRN